MSLAEAEHWVRVWLNSPCMCQPDDNWVMRPGPMGCPEHNGAGS